MSAKLQQVQIASRRGPNREYISQVAHYTNPKTYSKVYDLDGSKPINLGIVRGGGPKQYLLDSSQGRRDVFGGALGAASGIASTLAAGATAGSAAAAFLGPAAIGLGLGYGAYKLGESFKLW